MRLTGANQGTWRKNSPSETLSTTNPTWTDLEWNLGLCGDCLPVPWHGQGLGGRHAWGR